MLVDKKVSAMSDFIKLCNHGLYWHCVRTANLSCVLGKYLKCDAGLLYTAGLIHDIGKIGIPNIILNKPDKLNTEERKAIDTHSVIGYSIAKNIGVSEDICNMILLHHGEDKERFCVDIDISDNMRLNASVLQAADCYDALTTNRIYHEGFSHQAALMIMLNEGRISKDIIYGIDEVVKEGKGDLTVERVFDKSS